MEHQLPLTTLCYIEKDEKYLMLHRVSKDQDVNKGKWIGVGGHFESGESPEECLVREVREETGLTITSWRFRGLLTFSSEGWPDEYICLYTADYPGEEKSACCADTLKKCDEGELSWVPKKDLLSLNLWAGDQIFLKLLIDDAPFFSLKLNYRGDELIYAALDGRELDPAAACRSAVETMELIGVHESAAETMRAAKVQKAREASRKMESDTQIHLNSEMICDNTGDTE
ncbi:MAG: 8-oxo-dGTP diphosphatase [Clostridiales bacterium]|nr:8-oxo-dGTP diphosphatase [Clostridiales bacterium]